MGVGKKIFMRVKKSCIDRHCMNIIFHWIFNEFWADTVKYVTRLFVFLPSSLFERIV